ncbi:RNA-binding CRS1 / YhbY (CRM) domain protein [Euphorbia peplus]|nr:RNA-binding CRS1 / YhbY (CRM) domain protein [Euphorbia peplus]
MAVQRVYKSHVVLVQSMVSSPWPFFRKSLPYTTSLIHVISKDFSHSPLSRPTIRNPSFIGRLWIHSGPVVYDVDKHGEPSTPSIENAAVNGSSGAKVKRKKLKGKREVVKWLKFFRWKKKKQFERMTPEEKLLYKLKKARKKEERLLQSLKKIEPAESSEATHDPEILTPEEHFFFLKMGLKSKNYVPVGRRGIYQGVILNMHLHWKKHQTLQVVVKTFTPEEVKEIAAELARLTGGIVLDIHEKDTIIMYRGKNYSQPPTEIMSPRVTLPRKKALDKSKYRDGLRALRRYIPRLEQDLELLRAQPRAKSESESIPVEEIPESCIDGESVTNIPWKNSEKREVLDGKNQFSEDESGTDLGMISDSENLSDIFETDSETETQDSAKRPLYLDEFEKFPAQGSKGEAEDFEEHLRSKKLQSSENNEYSPSFDDVDRMFLRAASLLKKKNR